MAECNDYEGLRINPTPSSIGNQYAGVSTSDKPTGVPTYSIYLELDTGKFYYYDGAEWNEIPCACSGDGGGDEPSADSFRICFSDLSLIGSVGIASGYTIANAMDDGIFVPVPETQCIEVPPNTSIPPEISFGYVDTTLTVKTDVDGEILGTASLESPPVGPLPAGDGISYFIEGSPK